MSGKLRCFESITDFYDFTPQSVKLTDYHPHPFDVKYPIAI